MKTQTYQRLCLLYERHGPREFGKICQKLLALAFRVAGCNHVVERGVQGVDIDAAWAGEKYAAEVKTTRKLAIHLGTKDIVGLASRRHDGYRPLVGIMQLRPLSDWLLMDATNLKAGAWWIDALRPYRCVALEARIRPLFDGVLEAHFSATWFESQKYLNRLLQQLDITVAEPTSLRSLIMLDCGVLTTGNPGGPGP